MALRKHWGEELPTPAVDRKQQCIWFDAEQHSAILAYATQTNVSFSEAVRTLVEHGLECQDDCK